MVNDRIGRLREAILNEKPCLDVERLQFLKESYEETEGQPQVIRRAKVFEKFLKEKTIVIDDNPIVGTPTKHLVGVIPYPEISCGWMRQEVDFYTSFGKVSLSEEDKQLLLESVDYWADKCIEFKTDVAWRQYFSDNKEGVSTRYDDYCEAGVCFKSALNPWGRLNVDYGMVSHADIGLDDYVSTRLDEPLNTAQGCDSRLYRSRWILSPDNAQIGSAGCGAGCGGRRCHG